MGEEKNKKKGLLERLIGKKPAEKKSPCCGGFEIEEIPDDKTGPKDKEGAPKPPKGSCCG